ncbi:hypothetical protein IU450_35390 [Nocardia abscessus]|uniref:hypothetical protein n=1 Tax=Nocardia abscessus TaxID=120957 RepID=UPI001895EC8B|nr:hypothetical protein [Nocardia abscessus]MBF6341133.1 hypothetical protein [Nocardia abscessus]
MSGKTMQTKQETKPSSAMTQKADGRSWSGWYKLYNDTDDHVSVVRRNDSWTVMEQFVLAPGATSDQYEDAEVVRLRWAESGASTMITWNPDMTIHYNAGGTMTPNQVNNVSSL